MVVRLQLHLRKALTGKGEPTAVVHCPRLGRSRDSRDCLRCARLLSRWWDVERGGDIVCTAGVVEARSARCDFAERAVRIPLHEVLAGPTSCVPSDALAEDVLRVLEGSDVAIVAVVDAACRVMGTISKNALVGLPKRTRVADAMTVPAHVFSENAPVAHAIALMAFEDVEVVPVVADGNVLVGLLRARDLLRWTAEQMGYDSASAALPPAGAGTGGS